MPQRYDLGPAVAGIGAVLLIVSLFLAWFEPGLSAWTVFEALDLVLAAVALLTLLSIGARLAGRAALRVDALPLLGFLAVVIVVSQLLNHPPAAQGAGTETGAWLGLAGGALVLAGAALAAGRISLDVSFAPRRAEPGAPEQRPREEAAAAEPEVQEELYPEHGRSGPIGADDPETRG